jgi:hypothetical protein
VPQKPDLTRATLSTLHAFLSWVPLGYIFDSNLVEVLLRLFPQPPFRNLALQCLTEVCHEGRSRGSALSVLRPLAAGALRRAARCRLSRG